MKDYIKGRMRGRMKWCMRNGMRCKKGLERGRMRVI